MSVTLEAEFERGQEEFAAGDTVQACLFVKVTAAEVRLRSLQLRVEGAATCFLQESMQGVHVKEPYEDGKHRGKQALLHGDITLLARGHHVLQRGQHSFPFAFSIAAPTPGTLRLTHGCISYGLHASASLSDLLSRDVTMFREFSVLPRLDVTQRPQLKEPGIATGAVTDSSLANRGYTLRVSRRGFSPGDVVRLELHASAPLLARVASEPGLLQLIQTVVYQPPGAKLSQPCVLAKEVVPGCRFSGWERVELTVPVNALCSLPQESCAIMQRVFHLRINTALIQARIPIIIGTSPSTRTGAEGARPLPPLAAPQPEDPPPSYEEAMRLPAIANGNGLV